MTLTNPLDNTPRDNQENAKKEGEISRTGGDIVSKTPSTEIDSNKVRHEAENNTSQHKGRMCGDSSIFLRVIIPNVFFIPNGFIPKAYYSEFLFLSQKVITLKIFIPKGHYSKDFFTERSLFWISE